MRKCCFSEPFIREQIDPRVQTEWQSAFGVGAPFGKLRLLWKQVHCPILDPYNTGCPYRHDDCATEFLVAVQRTCWAAPKSPSGYFRSVARGLALDRVDNRPLARDDPTRTYVRKEGHTPGLRGRSTPRPGSPPGTPGSHQSGDVPVPSSEAGVHRAHHRFESVGDVLGSLNVGPHQRPAEDEQESNE